MRLIIFTLGVFVHFSCFSQVSNDDCFNASPLGALPDPANCGNGPNNNGQGDPVTFTNLTNVGAQTENPYTTLINCQGSGQDMASPATDVWYSFVPTGLSLDITINGLINDPNVALWTGNCGTLIGAGCDIGSGGSLTTTIDQLNPGDTYYLQISGGDSNDEGTFDLTLQNNVDCNACLLSSTMTVDPLPVNGTYQPGTIVTFCFMVDEWNQTNTNWFQGVVPIMGSSWTNLTPISSPQTCDSGPGIWDWFTGVTTPLGNSNGFFFDGAIAGFNPIPDGDPTNNFGDNCQGTGLNWEFCWQATVEDCPPGQTGDDLTVNVETYGDGETGNWSDVGCNFDPVFLFSASLACCASPTMSAVNASCSGVSDGSATSEAQTSASPWDFEWVDDSGNVISTTNNSNNSTNVISNIPAGTYTVTVTDDNGCVSSSSIEIIEPPLITPSFNQIADICNGDSFSLPNTSTNGINGSWLPTIDNTQTMTYTFSPDAGQCSSTADMTVTVNPQVTGTETYTGCQGDGYSVDVNGITYDEGNPSGTEVLTNSNGCDSTVTITLIYNNNTFGTEIYTGCQGDGYSVDVNGITYDEGNPSGTEVLTNSNGCDSTVTITLIYNNNTFGTETYTGCQGDGYSVVVNGVTYDEGNPSGTEVLTNSNSCDSTVTIDLIFNSTLSGTELYTGCQGDGYSVVVNGVTYDEGNPSGTEVLTAVAGCDSTVTITLIYNNNTFGTETYTGCQGDGYSVDVNGITYDEGNPSGTEVLTNSNGCDSTVTITLIYNNNTFGTETYTGCQGDGYSVVVNGVTYDEGNPSGTEVLTNSNSCDSTVTIDLIFNSTLSGTELYTGCQGDGYSVVVNGVTYDEGNASGTEVLTAVAGCDSTVTITLIYNNNTFGTEIYTGCQGDGYSVDVNGITYDEGNPSGTEVLTNSNGCDSTVTITLIYNNNTFGTETYTGCQGDGYSVVVNGVTYDEGNPSGTEVLTNSNSCDSTVTIDLIFNSTLSGAELYTGCQGDGYSVVVNGVTYDEGNPSGTEVLSAVAGCDSTVTITLIYNNNTFGTETYTGCQGDGYSVDVNGITYDEGNPSGTEVLTNSNGCDSTVTITLIYNNNTFGTETYTGCQGDGYSVVVNGVTYDEGNPSGTEVLTNSNSCDSTVTIALIFNALPTFTLLGNDPSVCNASDGSIIISGLIPLTQYTLSYEAFGSSQSFSITTDSFGDYMISDLTAGLYSDFTISLNGCEESALDVIDLNNPGAPSIDLQSSITECDTYTLSDITGTNLSGDQGYYTQSNGGGLQLNPGDVITTTQTIYIYDVLGTCADESSFTVIIDNTPSITNPGPQEVCGIYSLPLSIFGSNLSGNESFYNGLQSNGGTIIIDPILVSQTVYIYDENGACSNEVSFDVTVNELPTLSGFTGEGTYCDGDVINNLFAEVSGIPEFTLEYTLDGISYSINSSISSIDLGNTSGVYILTALNDNFCSVLINATQTITINSIPDMPIVSQDTIYCENSEPLDLQVSGGIGSYSWFSDESLLQLIGNSDSFTPSTSLGSTTYYVTTTENGCEGLPSAVTITFESCDIIIPTAFTPNDDSVNDTWELGSIDEIYPSNVVSIYNRWGSKVFESSSGTYNEKPWNGNYNGNKLPVGSYYFIIEFNDNYTLNKTGIVTIITD